MSESINFLLFVLQLFLSHLQLASQVLDLCPCFLCLGLVPAYLSGHRLLLLWLVCCLRHAFLTAGLHSRPGLCLGDLVLRELDQAWPLRSLAQLLLHWLLADRVMASEEQLLVLKVLCLGHV